MNTNNKKTSWEILPEEKFRILSEPLIVLHLILKNILKYRLIMKTLNVKYFMCVGGASI